MSGNHAAAAAATLKTGPFTIRVQLQHRPTLSLLKQLYRYHAFPEDEPLCDISLSLLRSSGKGSTGKRRSNLSHSTTPTRCSNGV